MTGIDKRFDAEADRFGFKDIRETSDFEYRPKSTAKVPQDVKDHFLTMGYELSFRRYTLDGKVDTANLREKAREGYTFVRPEELGEEFGLMGDKDTNDRFGEVITNGDLVLMKIPVEKAEAKRRYFQQVAKDKLDATNQFIRENNLENSSKTVTRKGKGASFRGD